MTFTFEGVSVALFMRTYELGGLLDVYLDGSYEATIDSMSSSPASNVKVFEKSGLRNGVHTLELKVIGDSARESVVIDAFEYVYDPDAPTEPPVTTATVSPADPDGHNGWYVHPITVTLTVEPAAAATEYSLDGGNTWQTYTAPITLDQDAAYSFSYRSTDPSGNVETPNTLNFRLDATAPVISVSGLTESRYSNDVELNLQFTVTDNLSGVDEAKTIAEFDGTPVQPNTTIPLYTLPLGMHKFTVQAVDLAGNSAKVEISFETYADLASLEALVQHFRDNQWIDNAGIVNSLVKKLENNQLNAFINEVKAQAGKHISAEAASYLLRDAQALINAK